MCKVSCKNPHKLLNYWQKCHGGTFHVYSVYDAMLHTLLYCDQTYKLTTIPNYKRKQIGNNLANLLFWNTVIYWISVFKVVGFGHFKCFPSMWVCFANAGGVCNVTFQIWDHFLSWSRLAILIIIPTIKRIHHQFWQLGYLQQCVVHASSVNDFKNKLDAYWSTQERMYNYRAEISGTGSRSATT